MNRRMFLASGITTIALSQMAKAFGSSPFFQGTVSEWSIPSVLGISEVLSMPRVVSRRQIRNMGSLESPVRTGAR